MSRRLSAAIALPALALLALGARKPDDPKHENHFRVVKLPESDVLSLAVTDAQAQTEFVQVGVKITNTTSDRLLILKKDEAAFDLPQGSFPAKAGGIGGLFGGPLLIPPNETRSHTFKVEGESGFHVDTVSLQARGFYVASNTGMPATAPDFQLPATVNDFTTGAFSCHLLNVKQETKETAAQFSCRYDGKGIGIVEPKKIGVRAKDQEFANTARKVPRDVLFPGETSKFTAVFDVPASVVDMQFATLQVLWRDTFSESTVTPVHLDKLDFVLDPDATAAANK